MSSYDHILVIGFGGPERPEDIEPFLREVTRGVPIPPERIAEVKYHYEAVGGRSPYNAHTVRLLHALRVRLQQSGVGLPVFLGMRNWHPFLRDVMKEIEARGLKRGIGIILAPHRSDNSFQKYQRNVLDAKAHAGVGDIAYDYVPAWFNHPRFVQAQADFVGQALRQIPESDRAQTPLLFCAHSIPTAMAQACRYVEEFECTSRLVAQQLGRTKWSLAYQSRSGNPREPWLSPDVESKLDELKAAGERHAVLVPVGFLCDNVEVLFDLDIEAKEGAQKLGIGLVRASTVTDHPAFVEMFVELVQGMAGRPRVIPLTESKAPSSGNLGRRPAREAQAPGAAHADSS